MILVADNLGLPRVAADKSTAHMVALEIHTEDRQGMVTLEADTRWDLDLGTVVLMVECLDMDYTDLDKVQDTWVVAAPKAVAVGMDR